MRYLVAPDKFKGTMAGLEVAEAIASGLRDGDPTAELDLLPIADGGLARRGPIGRAHSPEAIPNTKNPSANSGLSPARGGNKTGVINHSRNQNGHTYKHTKHTYRHTKTKAHWAFGVAG